MSASKNLELRGRTWWCIKIVPKSLRPIIGKACLRRSLATGDLAEALRLRPLVLADFAQVFEQARLQRSKHVDPVAQRALAWKRFTAEAVDDYGQPITDDAKADLIAEQTAALAKDYGPDAAERFEVIVAAPRFTPLDQHLTLFHREATTTAKTKAEQVMALRRLQAWDAKLCLENLDRKAAGSYVLHRLGILTSARTRNKHVSHLSSIWRFMLRRGLVDDNPWRDQYVPITGKKASGEALVERPFTEAEMVRLLRGDARPRLRDAMRIAALSGMRREEISMLRVRDCANGQFKIVEAKSKAGLRLIPIHSGLEALVAARMKGKRPDDFLIHELGPAPKPDSLRGRGAALTQEFKRYRESVGVQEDVGRRRSLVNFHSFRRFFATKAEQAGQPPWLIEAVLGHARSGMTLGVYSEGPSTVQLKQCVESVTLPAEGSVQVPLARGSDRIGT